MSYGTTCKRKIFFSIFQTIQYYRIGEQGSELVMNWMGCAATTVIGPRLVSLSDDSSGPLNRMSKDE
jgi:hypothetical protein